MNLPPSSVAAWCYSDYFGGGNLAGKRRKALCRGSTRCLTARWQAVELNRGRLINGARLQAVCSAADQLRQAVNGDAVSYTVNRNINYTK
jgi:hypothetical protein